MVNAKRVLCNRASHQLRECPIQDEAPPCRGGNARSWMKLRSRGGCIHLRRDYSGVGRFLGFSAGVSIIGARWSSLRRQNTPVLSCLAVIVASATLLVCLADPQRGFALKFVPSSLIEPQRRRCVDSSMVRVVTPDAAGMTICAVLSTSRHPARWRPERRKRRWPRR